MRSLITGANGFVGPHLAAHLLSAGGEVLGAAPRVQWPPWASDEVVDQVPLRVWDFDDGPESDAAILTQLEEFAPDVVFHLAALSLPPECGADEPNERARRINVGGTQRVLAVASKLAKRPRVIVISSSHVYGHPPTVPLTAQGADRTTEDAPPNPRGAYGKTKWAAEQQARRAVAEGADVVIVRAFPHAGPGQSRSLMLSEWASQLAAPRCDTLHVQTLDAIIDLADVRDVVAAYHAIAQRGRCGEVYNVGSGIPRRTGDIVDQLQEVAQTCVEVRQMRAGRKCDPIADLTKTTGETGWIPRVPLAQTMADTLAYWRKVIGLAPGGS